ncbi:MAG: o-succinylbenzoate synthase [Bacteroidetes bacterium]|nr:o-succinylbenzoate synthase [Bacteroidota bacterium]
MRHTADFHLLHLHFKKPAGTSRGELLNKPSYFLTITDNETGISGVGECSILPNLSLDDVPEVAVKLQEICYNINQHQSFELPVWINKFPAVRFALEMALLDLNNGGNALFYDTDFTIGKFGIPINGLIWMGNPSEMWQQIVEKIEAGFSVIKMKVGAIDFDSELSLIKKIRDTYGNKIELRLDANGAFGLDEAKKKLNALAPYNIHSIEQPIQAGNLPAMATLCSNSPIPIALDEELIGINSFDEKRQILNYIKPKYIILKPSLIGGFAMAEEWMDLAENNNIGWWATSALESNIGLNAIAQWVSQFKPKMPQGLGTGGLFTNNTPSLLFIENGNLFYQS